MTIMGQVWYDNHKTCHGYGALQIPFRSGLGLPMPKPGPPHWYHWAVRIQLGNEQRWAQVGAIALDITSLRAMASYLSLGSELKSIFFLVTYLWTLPSQIIAYDFPFWLSKVSMLANEAAKIHKCLPPDFYNSWSRSLIWSGLLKNSQMMGKKKNHIWWQRIFVSIIRGILRKVV